MSTIRTVIPSDKGNTKKDIMLTHNGEKVPMNEVAHYINDYFVKIGKEIGGNFTYQKRVRPTSDEEARSDKWSFSEVCIDEVIFFFFFFFI